MLDAMHLIIQLYTFQKKMVPDDEEEREIFIETLAKYGVSLKKYIAQLLTPKTRMAENDVAPEPRRSPRLTDSARNAVGDQVKHSLFSN